MGNAQGRPRRDLAELVNHRLHGFHRWVRSRRSPTGTDTALTVVGPRSSSEAKERIEDAARTHSICVIGEICGLFSYFPSPSPFEDQIL
jgi:hypothetical protein